MCRIPDGMKWSFSKLEAFHHCGMMFKLVYLDHAEKEGNGFSDYGTFCHKLLEEWAKGQIPDFALAEEYQERCFLKPVIAGTCFLYNIPAPKELRPYVISYDVGTKSVN